MTTGVPVGMVTGMDTNWTSLPRIEGKRARVIRPLKGLPGLLMVREKLMGSPGWMVVGPGGIG